MKEPAIVINGTRLTDGQAMTLRVAASDFLTQMREPDALGDDEHGRAMVTAYRAQLVLILQLMAE